MSGVLRTKKLFTICSPIPAFIPRQLAIDILHDHSEVITLNPLVISHTPIPAPQNAARDEYHSTWYEITERIQYIPGIGDMGSGKISFNGCFHNVPWGLQTHIYAPMSVDLRVDYRVAGEQPGVGPPAPREIGLAELGAPAEGLYLRADVEFKANFTLASFVRNQLKAAIQEMVDRMVRKAERLDAAVLQEMINEEKQHTADSDTKAQPTNVSQPQNMPTYQAYSNHNQPQNMPTYQAYSNHNQAPNAVELPDNYSNPQPGMYMPPAQNARPTSMSSQPSSQWSSPGYSQNTGRPW